MDARVEPKSRLSRWEREPVRDTLGKPKIARLAIRDIEIFKLLAKYTYLPFDDIHCFVGGSAQALGKRINLLYRRPNLYVDRPPQQRFADANYRHLIYELDQRGRAVLADLRLPHLPKKYHRNFAHELMACRIMLSFQLGAQKHESIRIIEWSEILAKMPGASQDAERPNHLPVTYELNGEVRKTEVVADWKPFGIERKINNQSFYRFFPGIEADTGTEPLEAGSFRSDIHGKFLAYLTICRERIYHSHFALPCFFIPFVTGSRPRMDHMMALLHKLTDGKGHSNFLFKTFPPLTSFQAPPPPSGAMLTEPWLRVGYPPLTLTEGS